MNVPSNMTGPLGIYEQSSTIPGGLVLGQKKEFVDGRIYRLAKNGAAEAAVGKLLIQGDEVANHVGITPTAAAIGARKVTVTLGATLATANQYQDGFLVIRTTGKSYKIKSHPAAALSTALVVELYDPLDVALAGTEEADLVANPYNGLVIAVTDQADIPRGIPIITVTAAYYFWLQTKGPCACLMDENITRGKAVTAGTSVAASLEMLDAAGEALIGHMIEAGVDTKYNLVDLCID